MYKSILGTKSLNLRVHVTYLTRKLKLLIIADIVLFELKSQQACLEVAAEGGATRYPAFLTGGQPAGAVSRMVERPNKRQPSPTHRDDASLDRNPDPNATYVPLNLSSNDPISICSHCTTCCLLSNISVHIVSGRDVRLHLTLSHSAFTFQKLLRPSASTTPRFNHPAEAELIVAITIIHPC